MATTNQEPPAKRQKFTSGYFEPPVSNEEVLAEITVSFDAPPNPHNTHDTHSPKDDEDDKMARTRGTLSRKTTNQRERPKRQSRPKRESPVMDDEFAPAEIKVSPSASKGRIVAKRSQLDVPAKTKSSAKSSAPPAAKKAKAASRSKKWEPDNVTQNSRSPLVDVDLRALLLQPAAWDCLTAEDQQDILALFPDETHILDAGTPNARPNLESLRNDDNFRHDAEQYVTNLAKGMHDPTWLKDAWTAHHRRAAGDFDAFYIRKVEVDWNVTIPDELKPPHLRSNQNGESSAGHSSQGEVSSVERLVGADAVAEKRNGVAKGDAVKPIAESKANLANIENSYGTPDSAEDANTSAKNSSTGTGRLQGRLAKEQTVLDEKLIELETKGENSPSNGIARDAAEGIHGSREKASGINGSKLMAAGEDATDPEDPMEVDSPEAHKHAD